MTTARVVTTVRAGSVGLALACLLALSLVFPSQASASLTRQEAILDWNAAGQAIGGGDFRWLIWKVPTELNNRNPSPKILTFQEVCRSQTDLLYQDDLRYRGFAPASFYIARSGVDGICNRGDFGNAVFIVGGGQNTNVRFHPYNQVTSQAEKRGMACTASYTQPELSVCSLHLVNANVPFADCQAAEAFQSYFDAWRDLGETMLVGGDFNIGIGTAEDGPPDGFPPGANYCYRWQPGYTALEHAYYWCWEADQYSGSSTRVTTTFGRKYDAIFIYKSGGNFWADLYLTRSESDHFMLTGYVQW